MKLLDEFKSFAIKGNMVDLAVGVIIGGAFGKIVASLVSDVIMPPLGFLIGGVQFSWLKFVIREAHVDASGQAVEAVTINYGNFLQASIDFLIIAMVIFMMIKLMNKLRDKEEQAAPPPAPSKEEALLTEIRDLLREQQKK